MIKKIGLLSLAAATGLMASGWRIPEQSVNATALSGAYVANAYGADAAYYNPANMAFMDEGSYVEGSLTYIHLTAIDYEGTIHNDVLGPVPASAKSEKENFVLPAFHFVGETHGDYRIGLSFTLPGGLSKRWEEGGASNLIAQEFTLEVYELNPVVSYKVADNFAIAAGLRVVYSQGKVKGSGGTVLDLTPAGGGPQQVALYRNMDGNDVSMGLNFAASYQPMDNWTLSTTYRSKVDLDETGKATLNAVAVTGAGGIPAGTSLGSYYGNAGITVPLPAVFALATAYTFNDSTTVELEFDRTFWGDYDKLDFTYPTPTGSTGSPVLDLAYNAPQARNWEHANAYRIGLTHEFNKAWTGMLGYAHDEAGAPEDTIGFELPDSNAKIYSFGARYHYNDQMSVGIGGLYIDKDEVRPSPANDLDGKFTDAAAYLLTVGIAYKF